MPFYITALLVTIAVEFLVYVVIIRQKALQLFLYSVLINCLTQPAAFYLLSQFNNNGDTLLYFIIVEFLVFLAEVFLIKLLLRVNYSKAVLLSFSANLITALLSFVI